LESLAALLLWALPLLKLGKGHVQGLKLARLELAFV